MPYLSIDRAVAKYIEPQQVQPGGEQSRGVRQEGVAVAVTLAPMSTETRAVCLFAYLFIYLNT
jgi:hypothetical protein